MDLFQAIRQLRFRRQQVERAIALLEDLSKDDSDHSIMIRQRRGRTSMGPEERQEVSKRMKTYWASRRQRKAS